MSRRRLQALAALLLATPAAAQEEETALFRITSLDGVVAQRTAWTAEETGRSFASPDRRAVRPLFEEQLLLRLRGSVFHPEFLSFDAGGGPTFAQTRYAVDGVRTSQDAVLWDLNARASFLTRKPSPVALYVERTNPWVAVGLAERFIQTDQKEGATWRLRGAGLPVSAEADAWTLRSTGRGAGRVVDDRLQHGNATVSRDRAAGAWRLGAAWDQRETRGGVVALGLSPARTRLFTTDASVHRTWGPVRFRATASGLDQDQRPERRSWRAAPNARWEIADGAVHGVSASARYDAFGGRTAGVESTSQAAGTTLEHRLYRSLYSTLDLRTSGETTDGFAQQSAGGFGSLTWTKTVGRSGRIRLRAAAGGDASTRRASVAQVPVIGESATLTGAVPASLSHRLVESTSVVVTNQARTQTYRLDIDYRLTVVGDVTRIERLLGGFIGDGESVLVDYAFRTGGSIRFTSVERLFEAEVAPVPGLRAWSRVRAIDPRVRAGTADVPLNRVRSLATGGDLSRPFGRVTAGISGEGEWHDETLSPFTSRGGSVWTQVSLPARLAGRASARRNRVEFARSAEDVDSTGGTVGMTWTPAGGRATLEAFQEDDRGGSLRRRRAGLEGSLDSRFRSLIVHVKGRAVREEQGVFHRTVMDVRAEIRREF